MIDSSTIDIGTTRLLNQKVKPDNPTSEWKTSDPEGKIVGVGVCKGGIGKEFSIYTNSGDCFHIQTELVSVVE